MAAEDGFHAAHHHQTSGDWKRLVRSPMSFHMRGNWIKLDRLAIPAAAVSARPDVSPSTMAACPFAADVAAIGGAMRGFGARPAAARPGKCRARGPGDGPRKA